jgi:hypothetical protein
MSALDLHQWLCLDSFRYEAGRKNAWIVRDAFDRLRLYRSV